MRSDSVFIECSFLWVTGCIEAERRRWRCHRRQPGGRAGAAANDRGDLGVRKPAQVVVCDRPALLVGQPWRAARGRRLVSATGRRRGRRWSRSVRPSERARTTSIALRWAIVTSHASTLASSGRTGRPASRTGTSPTRRRRRRRLREGAADSQHGRPVHLDDGLERQLARHEVDARRWSGTRTLVVLGHKQSRPVDDQDTYFVRCVPRILDSARGRLTSSPGASSSHHGHDRNEPSGNEPAVADGHESRWRCADRPFGRSADWLPTGRAGAGSIEERTTRDLSRRRPDLRVAHGDGATGTRRAVQTVGTPPGRSASPPGATRTPHECPVRLPRLALAAVRLQPHRRRHRRCTRQTVAAGESPSWAVEPSPTRSGHRPDASSNLTR